MIKYIFLDFDGTISDAHSSAVRALTRVFDELEFEFTRSDILRLIGDKLHIILKSLNIDPGHLDMVRRKFWEYFTGEIIEGPLKPCVSLKPLWELKKKYPLIIVSNSETKFLRASVKKLEIVGLFEKLYGAEKFLLKNDILKRLFKRYKIDPREAMYIGDRHTDIQCAREVGCWAVAIHNTKSWSNLETIQKENPDFIIKNFRGLKKIVKEIATTSTH